MEISKKIEDLAEEIKKTEKFKKYRKSKTDFENSQESRNLLNNFQEAKAELSILRSGAFDGVEGQSKKVEKLSNQVLKDKKIQKYKKARSQYKELVEGLAVAISKEIDFPIKLPEKKSCCR